MKIRNIQVVQEFIKKYIPFKEYWSFIEHERVFNNILMFLKISSGVNSMQAKLLATPQYKYTIGDRYRYL